MSCGCKTSGETGHSCGTKSATGCASVNTCNNSYKLMVFDWLQQVSQPGKEKCKWVEVRFKNDRKQFYLNTQDLPLAIGNLVAVEANPGFDVGVVSLTGELVKIQMAKKRVSEESPMKIYRQASAKDIETWQEARKKEESVKTESRKIAKRLNLEMKISDVEFQGDGTKATFYYTAEGRVDFRQLIKDYASTFRIKIDMKQIGYRQEAAKVGGIGSCGRELCCSTWLTDFRSVNTQAARYQQLSINPQKLAGQCGKLKCCLNYELDSYVESLSHFPSSSTVLDTEKGRAFCIKIDVFKKKMWFAYVESSIAWYDLDITDVKKLMSMNEKGLKAPALEDIKTDTSSAVTPDLIQENSVDRFEKKKKPKNHSQKNKERKSAVTVSESTENKKPEGQKGNNQNKKGKPHFKNKNNSNPNKPPRSNNENS